MPLLNAEPIPDREVIEDKASSNFWDSAKSVYDTVMNPDEVLPSGGVVGAAIGALGVAAKGKLKPPEKVMWYHGTNRLDRLLEKGKLDPKRATSGPAPYFTDDPKIASNYAANKPDTSLVDEGNVADYFTISPKSLGPAWSRSRTPVSVERSWNLLTSEQKATIADRAKRIGYANMEEADGPLVVHPEGTFATLSGQEHWEHTLRENKGNVLAALRDHWHDSGSLFGNEPELQRIYELAGYPHKISQENAPWFTAQGVLPAHMEFKSPLDTSDVDTLKQKVIPALREAFKRDRTRRKFEASPFNWDKDTRYTPREWLAQLEEDVAEGSNSFVWTSIPDKVSDHLRALGFDGIYDVGGKMGGEGHTVAIPLAKGTVTSPITGETLFSAAAPAGLLPIGSMVQDYFDSRPTPDPITGLPPLLPSTTEQDKGQSSKLEF